MWGVGIISWRQQPSWRNGQTLGKQAASRLQNPELKKNSYYTQQTCVLTQALLLNCWVTSRKSLPFSSCQISLYFKWMLGVRCSPALRNFWCWHSLCITHCGPFKTLASPWDSDSEQGHLAPADPLAYHTLFLSSTVCPELGWLTNLHLGFSQPQLWLFCQTSPITTLMPLPCSLPLSCNETQHSLLQGYNTYLCAES